jgi:amino acid adenylation domain-containing protein
MSPADLVSRLTQQGVRLWAEDGELRCRAPKGLLTPELRTLLAEHKVEILEWLRREPLHSPLSLGQEGLWFLERLEPGTAIYNIPFALDIAGALDAVALKRSINEIVRRHDALRTTFTITDGRPVQVVAPALRLDVPLVDLSSLPAAERDGEAMRLETEQARRPFDLTRGPLLRAMVLRLGADAATGEHRLLVTVHHIVWDLWSLGIFVRELAVLYPAFRDGRPAPLPELPLQYADFVAWQRQHLQGPAFEAQLDYWRQRLQGAPRVLDLPTDLPRPQKPTYRGGWQSFVLGPRLVTDLRALARQEGATLYMVLLAALQTLLFRYSGQARISVGTPTAGRQRAEFTGLIGLFVSMLVMHTDLSGNPTFRTLLARVREVALGAYAHQDVPFGRLVAALQPERESSRQPLYQVALAYEPDMLSPALEGTGMRLRFGMSYRWTALSDLTLFVLETRDGLRCGWEYSTDLFLPETMARMAGHYVTLLDGIAGNPDRRLGELPLLTVAERRLLAGWNDTRVALAPGSCVHEQFAAQAQRTPDAVAVTFEGQSLTYRQLNDRANRLARFLRRRGVGPDALVGLCLERSLEMVVGVLGILKAGGAYVPLEPTDPAERLRFMLEDAGISMTVTTQRVAAAVTGSRTALVRLDMDWPKIREEDWSDLESGATPEHLFYVVYTSGSTGRPKGVAIPHRSVANFIAWTQGRFPLRADDIVLQKTPFTFDISVWELCAPLLAGARLVVARPQAHRDCRYLIDCVRSHGVTQLHVVPTLLHALAADPAFVECRSLRRIYSAGEALPPGLVERVRSRLGVTLINLYGPTEANVDTCWVADAPGEPAVVPIGQPIANTQAYVLDAALQPVPVGVPGEVYIGGAGLARGYLGRPDLTAERFVPDPWGAVSGARLYRTGDRGRYLPDGNIEYLGRLDYQVKVRGFRVELGEIEATLAAHPEVREAAAVLREDRPGEQRLVAYVVPRQGATPSGDALRQFLRGRLPEHMVPAAFVPLAAFPVTASGKVDRRSLPVPEPPGAVASHTSPGNLIEWQLAQIWEEILDIRPVGVTDSFFDLGGHSVLAVRLMSAIEQSLGQTLPLTTLFEAPTIRGLADALRREAADRFSSPVTVLHPEGPRIPFVFLHGDYSGGGFYCHALARALGPQQPFILIHPHGLDGRRVPPSIEAMADEHLVRLRAVRPHGPYLLGGHCTGGRIAFEMARRLRAAGERVDLVAVVDAPLFNTGVGARALSALIHGAGAVARWAPEERLSRLARLRWLVLRLSRLPDYYRRRGGAFVRAGLSEQCATLRRKMRRVRAPAGGWSWPTAAAQLDPTALPDGVDRAYRRAIIAYTPGRYAGTVTVVRAIDGDDHRPDLGWGAVARTVEIHEIPGDHLTCLTKHTAVLAERLAACLEKGQRESGGSAAAG